MPAGENLTPGEISALDRAIHGAEAASGLTFSVYVGPAEEDSRGYAERLHAALTEPATSVLIMCDPAFRALEVVTGVEARRVLDDVTCGLAAASMRASFQADDLVGGLVLGIQQLGQAARRPRTLHRS